MTVFLAACNSNTTDDKATDSAETKTSKSEQGTHDDNTLSDKTDASLKTEEEVTLSLMVTTRPTTDSKDFYLDWLPELVKEEYPHINIEVEQLPTDQYKQTVRLKFASGQGPDI
ncbi:MAG TPA: extracellular solute-binding protein, partial [Candidatus Merdenecus merdavium]|nr:extracellular solute-binding protein [Candidatus Merdenecus merdavium]